MSYPQSKLVVQLVRAQSSKMVQAATWVLLFSMFGCGDPVGKEDPESAEPLPSSVCDESSSSFLKLGNELNAEFVEFQEGDELELEFASQSGMEGSLSLRSSGFKQTEIQRITCQIIFDGAPLGETTTNGGRLTCDEDSRHLTLHTSIPIEVGDHPTVSSVAQVDGKSAELHVEFEGADGLIAEQTVSVTLVL